MPAPEAAGYLRQKVGDGRVWVIGPDYIGGRDQIAGFVDAFRKAGGKLVHPRGSSVVWSSCLAMDSSVSPHCLP